MVEEAPVTRPFMMGPVPASMPPATGEPGTAQQQPQTGYSVPGVLQFIKQEFNRFERERGNWEVERAELQVSHFDWPSFFILNIYIKVEDSVFTRRKKRSR